MVSTAGYLALRGGQSEESKEVALPVEAIAEKSVSPRTPRPAFKNKTVLRAKELLTSGQPGLVIGKVVSIKNDEPVPGVDVFFFKRGVELAETTDPNGEFTIKLERGTYRVSAQGRGLVAVGQPVVQVGNQTKPIQIVLKVSEMLEVTGTVFTDAEAPSPGATVLYASASSSSQKDAEMGFFEDRTQSDSSGRYSLFVPMEEGTVTLEAQQGVLRGRRDFRVVPGEKLADVDIVLSGSVRVFGRVLNPTGTGAENADVFVTVVTQGKSVSSTNVTTDTSGNFTFEELPTGVAVFEARAEGVAPSIPLEKDLGSSRRHSLKLSLSSPQELLGRVVDVNGEPVPDAGVHVRRGGSKAKAIGTRTDESGNFAIENIDNGPHWVSAQKRGFAKTIIHSVRAPTRDLELVLAENGVLEGTVLGADKRPIGSFIVRFDRFKQLGLRGFKKHRKSSRESDGAFAISSLAPGVYDLTIEASGYKPKRVKNVKVPPGETAKIRASLAR